MIVFSRDYWCLIPSWWLIKDDFLISIIGQFNRRPKNIAVYIIICGFA